MQAAADSIVLEEEIDPNYVPSEEEVIEYAKWLGMDLEKDKDLYWIAREGLMAPLPKSWKPCKTKDTEDIYYFNFSTGESTWDHPCDGYYKRLYEEEKKKKEISIKETGDQKRSKAKQDVGELLGKAEKKKKKKNKSMDLGNLELSKSVPAPLSSLTSLERKPLGGIRPLSTSLDTAADPSPLQHHSSEPKLGSGVGKSKASGKLLAAVGGGELDSKPSQEAKVEPLGDLRVGRRLDAPPLGRIGDSPNLAHPKISAREEPTAMYEKPTPSDNKPFEEKQERHRSLSPALRPLTSSPVQYTDRPQLQVTETRKSLVADSHRDSEELQQWRSRCADWEGRCAALETRLKEAQADRDHYQSLYSRAQDSQREADQRFFASEQLLRERAQSAEDERDAAVRERQQLRREITDLESRHAGSGDSGKTDKTQLEALQKEVDGRDGTIRELERKMVELNTSIAALTSDKQALQSGHAAEISRLKSELAAAQDRERLSTQELAAATQSRLVLEQRLRHEELRTKQLQEEQEHTKKQLLDLQSHSEQPSGPSHDQSQLMAGLQRQVRTLETQLLEQRDRAEQSQKQSESLQLVLENERSTHVGKESELLARVSGLEQQTLALDTQLKQTQFKLKLGEEELRGSRDRTETLQKDLDGAREKGRRLESDLSELTALSQSSQATATQWEGERQTLSRERLELQNQVSELRLRIQELSRPQETPTGPQTDKKGGETEALLKELGDLRIQYEQDRLQGKQEMQATEREKATLRGQLSRKEMELSHAMEELNRTVGLDEKTRTLETQNGELAAELALLKTSHGLLKTQEQNARDRCQQLEQQLKQQQAQQQEQKRTDQQQQKQDTMDFSAMKELLELRSTVEKLHSEAAQKDKKMRMYQEELIGLQKKVGTGGSSAPSTPASDSRTAMVDSLRSSEDQLASVAARVVRLEQELQERDARISQLEGNATTVVTRHTEQLRQQQDMYQRQLDASGQLVDGLRKELLEAKASQVRLEADLSRKGFELAQLQTLSSTTSPTPAEEPQQAQWLQEWKQRCETIQKEKSELQMELVGLQQRESTLKSDQELSALRLQRAQEDCAQFQEQWRLAEASVTRLRQEMAVLQQSSVQTQVLGLEVLELKRLRDATKEELLHTHTRLVACQAEKDRALQAAASERTSTDALRKEVQSLQDKLRATLNIPIPANARLSTSSRGTQTVDPAPLPVDPRPAATPEKNFAANSSAPQPRDVNKENYVNIHHEPTDPNWAGTNFPNFGRFATQARFPDQTEVTMLLQRQQNSIVRLEQQIEALRMASLTAVPRMETAPTGQGYLELVAVLQRQWQEALLEMKQQQRSFEANATGLLQRPREWTRSPKRTSGKRGDPKHNYTSHQTRRSTAAQAETPDTMSLMDSPTQSSPSASSPADSLSLLSPGPVIFVPSSSGDTDAPLHKDQLLLKVSALVREFLLALKMRQLKDFDPEDFGTDELEQFLGVCAEVLRKDAGLSRALETEVLRFKRGIKKEQQLVKLLKADFKSRRSSSSGAARESKAAADLINRRTLTVNDCIDQLRAVQGLTASRRQKVRRLADSVRELEEELSLGNTGRLQEMCRGVKRKFRDVETDLLQLTNMTSSVFSTETTHSRPGSGHLNRRDADVFVSSSSGRGKGVHWQEAGHGTQYQQKGSQDDLDLSTKGGQGRLYARTNSLSPSRTKEAATGSRAGRGSNLGALELSAAASAIQQRMHVSRTNGPIVLREGFGVEADRPLRGFETLPSSLLASNPELRQQLLKKQIDKINHRQQHSIRAYDHHAGWLDNLRKEMGTLSLQPGSRSSQAGPAYGNSTGKGPHSVLTPAAEYAIKSGGYQRFLQEMQHSRPAEAEQSLPRSSKERSPVKSFGSRSTTGFVSIGVSPTAGPSSDVLREGLGSPGGSSLSDSIHVFQL